MKPEKITILIEQEADGWHVIAHVDGALVEKSPPLPGREYARAMAEKVSERFEAQFHRVNGNWKRTT